MPSYWPHPFDNVGTLSVVGSKVASGVPDGVEKRAKVAFSVMMSVEGDVALDMEMGIRALTCARSCGGQTENPF